MDAATKRSNNNNNKLLYHNCKKQQQALKCPNPAQLGNEGKGNGGSKRDLLKVYIYIVHSTIHCFDLDSVYIGV